MNAPVLIPSVSDDESLRLATRMNALASAMAASEGIDDFASSGWLPDNFFDLLAEFYGVYDAYITHNIAASSLKIMCRAGCSRCCHQAVHGVYSFEIIAMYRHLRERADYPQIHNACAKYADEFQAIMARFLRPGEATISSGHPALPQVLQAAAAAAKPCPLLNGSNCGVYEHRPVPCRMYHSLTNPIFCTTALGHTFSLEPPEETHRILNAIHERLAFPFSDYLVQGLVSFAFRRQFQPWTQAGPGRSQSQSV
jgi:Fe-S-cluster containining protein